MGEITIRQAQDQFARDTTVALESTGVYWIPLYDILEQRGMRPCLVNARHMKNVPGRRTDWHECQWLQFLHSVGLLRASFRPEQDICAVRAVLRHRSELVMAASQHVQHMHKALTEVRHDTVAKQPNPVRISSSGGKVCTTFGIGFQPFWNA